MSYSNRVSVEGFGHNRIKTVAHSGLEVRLLGNASARFIILTSVYRLIRSVRRGATVWGSAVEW